MTVCERSSGGCGFSIVEWIVVACCGCNEWRVEKWGPVFFIVVIALCKETGSGVTGKVKKEEESRGWCLGGIGVVVIVVERGFMKVMRVFSVDMKAEADDRLTDKFASQVSE